jgi:hypothetical protein
VTQAKAALMACAERSAARIDDANNRIAKIHRDQ